MKGSGLGAWLEALQSGMAGSRQGKPVEALNGSRSRLKLIRRQPLAIARAGSAPAQELAKGLEQLRGIARNPHGLSDKLRQAHQPQESKLRNRRTTTPVLQPAALVVEAMQIAFNNLGQAKLTPAKGTVRTCKEDTSMNH